jgi:hypothetical protein
MKSILRCLMLLLGLGLLSVHGTASVNITNNTPGVIRFVTMYTVVDNGEFGVTTFSCDHFLHYGQSLVFVDSPPVSHYLIGESLVPVPPMDDGNYSWNWEELPGYPVGRTWNGVTPDPDFPAWNWSNWPNNWFMVSPDDIDNQAKWGLTGYVAPAITVEAAEIWESAEELRRIQRLQKLGKIVRISKSGALTIPASMLVAVWVQSEMERNQRNQMWSYVVYEKVNPASGKVYTGRASGLGSPATVFARRNAAHVILNGLNFTDNTLSLHVSTRGQSLWALAMIRGREQQVMDYHGGALSGRGYNPSVPTPGYPEGRTRAVNLIRGVRKDNPLGESYWQTSTDWAGFVYRYTGDEQWYKMAVPQDLGLVILVPPTASPPRFYPN